MFTYTNKCCQLDLVNKNYKVSYINIIYREIMARLMYKKYSKFLMMKHSVLLFINLALVFFIFFFTKIVSTLYTGLYISFFFSHINITHPKTGTTTISERSTREEKKDKTQEVADPKNSFLHNLKLSEMSKRGIDPF